MIKQNGMILLLSILAVIVGLQFITFCKVNYTISANGQAKSGGEEWVLEVKATSDAAIKAQKSVCGKNHRSEITDLFLYTKIVRVFKSEFPGEEVRLEAVFWGIGQRNSMLKYANNQLQKFCDR
jgi:hypothetical protein